MLWSLAICSIVLVPRIKAIEFMNQAILLDDLVFALVILVTSVKYIASFAVEGKTNIVFPRTGSTFAVLIIWKLLVLLIGVFAIGIAQTRESAFLIGEGVQLGEGVLVIGKNVAFFSLFLFTFLNLNKEYKCLEAIRVYFGCVFIISIIAVIQFVLFNNDVVTSTFRNIYILSRDHPHGLGMDDPWFGRSGVGHEHFGAFILLSFSLVLGQILVGERRSLISNLYLYLLMGLCVFCLIFCSSRGVWIGSFFSLSAWLWYTHKNKITYKLFVGVVGVLLVVVTLKNYSNIDVFGYVYLRIEGILAGIDGSITDDSSKHRIVLLKALLDIFWEFPIAGLGAGGLGRIGESQYMRELIEGGIIGFLVFSVLITGILSVSLQGCRATQNPTVRGLSVGFFCGVIGILGQALFTDLLIVTKVGVSFWFVAGIVQRLHLSSLDASKVSMTPS